MSSTGIVKSLTRNILRADGKPLRIAGRTLKQTINNRGYARLCLTKDGKTWHCGVHQVVARAWLTKPKRSIGSRHGEFVVNHKDGNKLNNHASNLEYITAEANVRHARSNGLLSAKGERNNKAKLTADDVIMIRDLYSKGVVQVELARRFSVNQTTISLIVLRKGWSHVA